MIKTMYLMCIISFVTALCCASQPVFAQDITVGITVVKASNNGTEFDSSLTGIKSQLARLNYTSYKQIKTDQKTGQPREEVWFDLPNGDRMRVVLLGIENTYIKLLVSMEQAGLKTHFKIINNGTVIVGGNEYEDGYLVVALTASY
ncbi:MAG: hypothetical protein C4541_06275 [Candidatus Auribacter fodinae]|jgi:hypothetical protein|uniref:Uncharacterized protein n=1 Tax=Candidatus Auribacter fodinae TaxID=2093366 RepID=A0A3A4QZL7_9BACT|nr:MAG: hypothetical protein C4541_06275 [Candidatus Auribacter fodinae]